MVTLAYIRETLCNYHPRSEEQGNVKAVLTLFNESDPQPSDADCLNNLREDLPVEVLYSLEVLKGPTTLYRIIRAYLELIGLSYHRHPSSPRISYGLVNMFCDEDEDKAYALNNLTHLRASPAVSQIGVPAPEPTRNSDDNRSRNDSKMAHNIASRFKTSDRFSGKLGPELQEFIDNYLDACSDYDLNREQRLRFFHNVFTTFSMAKQNAFKENT